MRSSAIAISRSLGCITPPMAQSGSIHFAGTRPRLAQALTAARDRPKFDAMPLVDPAAAIATRMSFCDFIVDVVCSKSLYVVVGVDTLSSDNMPIKTTA